MPWRGRICANRVCVRAIELRHGDDIAAEIGEVDDGEMQRRLPARHGERRDAAFERGDALFQHSDWSDC